jgi:hypothetical protein
VIGAFGQRPIYGWVFFNQGAEPFVTWRDRVSLDARLAEHGTQTLDLFQEDGRRILEVRLRSGTLGRVQGGCEGGTVNTTV